MRQGLDAAAANILKLSEPTSRRRADAGDSATLDSKGSECSGAMFPQKPLETRPTTVSSKSARIPLRYHTVAPGETPTVLFPYPAELKIPPRADPVLSIQKPRKWPRMKYLLYWERNCIKTVFHAAGLTRSSAKDPARYKHDPHAIQGGPGGGDWHVAWSKHFPAEQYR